jgi:hypothetical protein
MEFLTAEEVAKILRVSVWFVYQNRQFFGGIKLGKIVRFDKEIFESKIKEVIEGDGLSASGQMEIRLLEERSAPKGKRLSDKTRSKIRRSRSEKKTERDERDIYRFMRGSPERR